MRRDCHGKTSFLLLALLLLCAAPWPADTVQAAGPATSSATLQVKVIILPRIMAANIAIETVAGQDALIVKASKGVPPYTATLENAGLAQVTRVDDATFRITGTVEGNTFMVIRDSRGSSLSCDLQVRTCLDTPQSQP